MKNKLLPLLIASVLIFPAFPHANAKGNTSNNSFRKAKEKIAVIWAENPKTFYCQCDYKGKTPIPESCGYIPLRENIRSKRIEWEHIVPASRFGGRAFDSKDCRGKWRLECNRRKFILSDLYNLVPAIGELNNRRSNYNFGIIPGELRMFGFCDFEIGPGRAEPAPEIRGDIARIYFYMAWAYPEYIQLSEDEKNRFRKWDQEDRPDDWEIKRSLMIHNIQGNINPFIK